MPKLHFWCYCRATRAILRSDWMFSFFGSRQCVWSLSLSCAPNVLTLFLFYCLWVSVKSACLGVVEHAAAMIIHCYGLDVSLGMIIQLCNMKHCHITCICKQVHHGCSYMIAHSIRGGVSFAISCLLCNIIHALWLIRALRFLPRCRLLFRIMSLAQRMLRCFGSTSNCRGANATEFNMRYIRRVWEAWCAHSNYGRVKPREVYWWCLGFQYEELYW